MVASGFFSLFYTVRKTCNFAKGKYAGKCQTALVAVLEDEKAIRWVKNAKFVEQSPALQVANGYGYGFLLGNSTDHASGLNGSIFYFSLYPFALTPLQIKAEYQYAVSGINKV